VSKAKLEWLLGSVLVPLILVVAPLFSGGKLRNSVRNGELMVFSLTLAVGLLLAGIFLQHAKTTSDGILYHIIACFVLVFVLSVAYASRFDDGAMKPYSSAGVAFTVALAAVSIVLGLLRPVKPAAKIKPKIQKPGP
jgi:peptidoglycan/LPS O-acetylase OafA/YrhL